jgi:hypothetical protein
MKIAVLTAMLVAAVVLAVAGCGGSGKRTIPTKKAESMLQQLDRVGSQVDNQACLGAADKVRSLETQALALPSSVDRTVKRNLVAGLRRLGALVASQCQRQTPTTTTTVPTNTITTNTVPTNTVPTNTVPTNTVPTNTVPPTNTTPTTPGGGGGVTVPGGTSGAGGAQLGVGGDG